VNDQLYQFGQRVRELRKLKKMSQEELAYAAGLDRTYIGSVERGRRNISLMNILKIADALEVKPSLLLETFDAKR
jgi:transcriptional regulator with XRE-family HTH domain